MESTPLKRFFTFAGDIKVNHTLFAMPWALLAAALASYVHPHSFTWGKIGLIILCMIAARTVAMSANRLLDAKIDAKNPRTAKRAIPSGKLTPRFFAAALAICSGAFLLGAGAFEIFYRNLWPLALSLPVLGFLCGYPLLKRFSEFCHFYLGIALALAPVCAWLAISGRLDWPPAIMFIAVLSWTAGFDIIYACQDYESDVAQHIHSVPARLGIRKALWVSRMCHAVSAAMIILLSYAASFGFLYAVGATLAILLLIVEQSMVKPTDLSKANLAFFTVNGIVSVLLGSLGILDLICR